MNTDKRSRDLTRAFPDDPDRLSLPHDRLAATAQQDPHPGQARRTTLLTAGPSAARATRHTDASRLRSASKQADSCSART